MFSRTIMILAAAASVDGVRRREARGNMALEDVIIKNIIPNLE